MTDYPDHDLIENIAWNASQLPAGARGRVSILGYLWGSDVTPLLQTLRESPTDSMAHFFDLIILADLIFNHTQHAALLRTCRACLRPQHCETDKRPAPRILVFFSHHRPWLADRDLGFFALAENEGFVARKRGEWLMRPMFEVDRGDERVRATVHAYEMMWREEQRD